MKPTLALRNFLGSSLLAALLTSPAAFAANIWDGGGGDNNWATVLNWDDDALPGTGALTFAGNVQNSTSNDLVAVDPSFAGILFTNDGSAGNTNDFTLAGSRITLGGDITTTANTAGTTITDIISLNMILNGNRIITTNQQSDTVQHNLTISGIITQDVAGRTLTKAGGGILTLSGTNTYTGTTSISAGTLQNGSNTTFTNKGSLTLSSTGIFDLGGFNASFTSLASVAGNTITNNSAATDPSNATAPGTPSGVGVYVDALTFTTAAQTINAKVQDGATRKTQLVINNNKSAVNFGGITNTANNFTGGLVLAHNATALGGTRLAISSLITDNRLGTGPIIVGQANTDRAQIMFNTVNNITLTNDIIINTAAGIDTPGNIRVDTTGNILSGKITANLADVRFRSFGSVSLTGQVTGGFGLRHDDHIGTVTLNNAGTANNYVGNTTIGTATENSILTLGRANQIPNGTSTGNVSLNGTLNMGGFSETINGLSGGTTGILDGISGSPTLTLGDNNATGLTFSGVIRNTAGTLAVTKTGSGTQTLSGANTYSGGTRIDNGTLTLGHATNTLANTGAVNVNGGTLALGTNTDTVGAVTLTSGSITGTGAGTLTGTGSAFDVRSGTISAKLGGTVGLTKTTAGSVTISSDNSVGGYTGATLVSAGSLVINGNISTSITTTVDGTGTLAGIGTVGATTVQAGGTLAPGNSIGTLNFTNTLSLAGISNFEIDPTLGLGLNRASDLANVTNGVTYGGTLNVLYGGLASDFTNGMIFNLFDGSSFSGSFGSVNLPSLTGGLSWQDNLLTNGTLTVIPEPSAALLGGLGLLALLRRRRN